MRRWIILTSDPHAGSSGAPVPPDLELAASDDGTVEPRIVEPNALQARLWLWWLEDLEAIEKVIAGEPAASLCVGDITEGDRTKHKDKSLVADSRDDQVAIACALYEPIARMPNVEMMWFCKGTDSHNFNGEAERLVADRLRYTMNANTMAYHHYEIETGSVILDVAHHGPGPGIREWLVGNELRRYVQDIQREEDKNRRPLPAAIIRGHFHRRVIERVPFHRDTLSDITWGIICPSYCTVNNWTRKATKSKRHVSVGMLLLEIHDGEIARIHEFMHHISLHKGVTW